MRKSVCALLAAFTVMALCLAACGQQQTPPVTEKETATTEYVQPVVTLTLATTGVVNDSGLLKYLEPYLLEEEKIVLHIMVHRETADAIKTAEDGGCDVLIAHGPAAEKDFVDKSCGVDRREFMHNFFAIAGPKADPAKVSGAKGAAAALEGMYDTYLKGDKGCVFYSRNDGTWADRKEKNLWVDRGIDPEALPAKFYQKTGKGMRDTLLAAEGAGGYVVTDKLTFLQTAGELDHLEILLDNNSNLKNIYSVTLIDPEEYPELQHEAAKRFSGWLRLPSTQALIAAYGKTQYGEALFFVE